MDPTRPDRIAVRGLTGPQTARVLWALRVQPGYRGITMGQHLPVNILSTCTALNNKNQEFCLEHRHDDIRSA